MDFLKKALFSSTPNQAMKKCVLYISLWMMLGIVLQQIKELSPVDLPDGIVNGIIFILFFGGNIAALIAFADYVRLRRLQPDKDKQLIEQEAQAREGDKPGYQMLDFSALGENDLQGKNGLMATLSLTSLLLGISFGAVGLALSAKEGLPSEGWVFFVIIVLVSIGLGILGLRKFKFSSQAGASLPRFAQFANDNHFIFTKKVEDDQLVAEFRECSKVGDSSRLDPKFMLQGSYRSIPFAMVVIHRYGSRTGTYYGIAKFSLPTGVVPKTMPFEQSLKSLAIDVSVEYGQTAVYCVFIDGLPVDRAGVIRLFQVFDKYIEVSIN